VEKISFLEPWVKKIFIRLRKKQFYGKIEITYQQGRAIRIDEKRVHLPKDFSTDLKSGRI